MAGIPDVQRFFRSVGGVDVDKTDVQRFWIAPQDLPITRGLQERMRVFGKLDEAEEIRELLLRGTLRRPPDEVTFGEETGDVLTGGFGGGRGPVVPARGTVRARPG
jgi:hypothetical protein